MIVTWVVLTAADPAEKATARSMPASLVLLLATACGVAVANTYYAQPLLAAIERTLHTGSAVAGLTITGSQIAYAAGLILLVPLGDLVDRRLLVVALLSVAAAALLTTAWAPGIGFLFAALAVVGVTSVVAQILVALAAHLAPDAERGRVVGTVMSGLLLGILLARTLAGVIAEVAGWRAVYLVATVLIVALTVTLHLCLPRVPIPARTSYGMLLRSVLTLIGRHPVLRRRMAYGALTFASFSAFWTSMAFLLDAPPYRFTEGVIGLFGLIGVAGAVCGMASGRLADRGLTRPATGLYFAILVLSFVLLWLGATQLIALVLGIVALDAGVQGAHILNQSTIYELDAQARSRLTTAYMTAYFAGGAVGSTLGSLAYERLGWPGVCLVGGGTAVLALLLWTTEQGPWRRSASGNGGRMETASDGPEARSSGTVSAPVPTQLDQAV